MTYSMKLYPNEQSEFPPPPSWLVWSQEIGWDYNTRSRVVHSTGQVRHHDTLAVAKKNVGRCDGDGAFWCDWAIYEWDPKAQRYEPRHKGKKGDLRKDHPLWKRGAVPKTKAFREVTEDDMTKVLESLAGVL